MRFSQLLIPTLRDVPGEAETVSHRLLLRAGLIRKVAAGIYTYLPLGLRALRRVEQIVREEMNRAGAQEVLMPVASPAELWRETGRWDFYGKELLRFKDRHERDFCLGPTHEEVITDLFRREVRSYRQLPVNFYQIQTKFRDEIRPRFGLMRGREFIMKDAYSFDRDEAGARLSYQKMYDAYTRIFTRCGLTFRAVEADTGLIGGTSSHEFMVLAETGEETIVYTDAGTYAANVERAELLPEPPPETQFDYAALQSVSTPGVTSIEQVARFLKVAQKRVVKTLLYTAGDQTVAVMVRGDHEVNPIKVARLLGAVEATLATPEAVQAATGAPVGFAGPIGLKNVTVLADHGIAHMRNMVVGANQADTHYTNANFERDFPLPRFADLRNAKAGDPSPRGDGPMKVAKGIEVGHVFMLGTKYSQAMQAKFLDAQGQDQLAIMGCYGIGVSRVVAAAIEQNHDAKGIIWPLPLAPFQVHLIPLSPWDQVQRLAEQLHDQLSAVGIDVLWDDRDERAGVKLNDADLLGTPFHLVLGDKSLAQGHVEWKHRRTGEVVKIAPDQVVAHAQAALRT
ncbi:MAG: proline--tRNA ligase [Nitrospiraceae bacterium]